MCYTKPFLLLATKDHWPWGEIETKANLELPNPELLERQAIFLCFLFSLAWAAVNCFVGQRGWARGCPGAKHLPGRLARCGCLPGKRLDSSQHRRDGAGSMNDGDGEERQEQFVSRARDKNQLEWRENKT